jgi:DNA-binding transcriptional LysR family regulator
MIYNNYEYFLEIVKHQNITKASSELFISQPALSNYLKRLEEKLGTTLFEHKSQPLKLNYSGERYLYYLNKYIVIRKQLENELAEINSKERGKIRIGISPWRSSYILPAILPGFSSQNPNIEIITIEGVENELCDLVDSDKVDFSIKSFSNPNPKYQIENIMNERILLAINSKNPIIDDLRLDKSFNSKNIKHIDINTVKNEKFILPKPSQELYSVIQSMLTMNKIEINGFETSNVATALNLVSKNYGLTFVPESRITHSQHLNDILFFTVGSPILFWYLTIIYRKDTYLTNLARIFVNSLDVYCNPID